MTTPARLALAAAGLALAVVGFAAIASIPRGPHEFLYAAHYIVATLTFPFGPMNGVLPSLASSYLARALFLGAGAVLLGAAAGARAPALLMRLCARDLRVPAIALHLALIAAVAFAVIDGAPLQDDDPTYLMQGELLAHGRIFDETTPPGSAFLEPFTVFTERGSTGKYLFGTPLVLALGARLGAPLLGNFLLATLAALLWYRYHAGRASSEVARLALLLWCVSPAIAVTTATPVSQVPALACAVVAIESSTRARLRDGLVAGLAVGFALAARPQSAVPLGVVIAAMALRRGSRFAVGLVAGGAPWALAVALYARHVTGSPTRLPWELFAVERYGFGFPFLKPGVVLPAAYEHTIAKGLAGAAVALVRMNAWCLGWPISLFGVAAWLAAGRPHRAAVAPWLGLALATFAFQLAYYSTGTHETGAGYHYLAQPFVLSATAAAVIDAAHRGRTVLPGFALASFLLGWPSFVFEQGDRLARLVAAITSSEERYEVTPPALVLRELNPVVHVQFGWVLGLPRRLRGAWAPVVEYPRGSSQSVSTLMARWGDRACVYVSRPSIFEPARGVPCDRMAPLVNDALRRFERGEFPYPHAFAGVPHYAGTGWKRDFPWVGWFGLPGFGEPWPPGF